MNTDEHRLFKTGTGEALTFLVRYLCLSVFICGSKLWQFLRAVLDDDAYDRYATRRSSVIPSEVEGPACLLTASEFYRLRLEEKYSRPTRCC